MNTYEAVKQLRFPRKNSKYAKVDLVRLASATEQTTAKVYRDLCRLKEAGAIEIVRGRDHDKVRVTSPTQNFLDRLPEILNPKVEE